MSIIALDGNESAAGRALLCLSALYHCADRLDGVRVRLIDISDANVLLAVEALRWDLGLDVDAWPVGRAASEGSPLEGVSLYAGIACGSARHMRLDEARQRQVPTLLAMQFPEPKWLCPKLAIPEDAAFDPKLFAEAIVDIAVEGNGAIVSVDEESCDRQGCPDASLHTWLAGALVDVGWYRATYPDVAAADVDPVRHYFEFGWREGRNPSAWFATQWYLDRNPEAGEADDTPLHHFVRQGAHAGCRPHPDFDIAWYSRHYLGLEYPSHVALRHFLVVGERDGNAPAPSAPADDLSSALVDPGWYCTAYPDVAEADVDPVRHYFDIGWREGRDPCAWFATRWYLRQNPGAGEAAGSPLHHFVHEGAKAGCRPHPDFDVAWYSRAHLGVDHPTAEALRHFLDVGLATDGVPNSGLDHRQIRARLPHRGRIHRSEVLKALAGLRRAARHGRRWDDGEAELWPVLMARDVPEGGTVVLVIHDGSSDAMPGLARMLARALPIHEAALFALAEGAHRIRLFDRIDDPQASLLFDLPEQIAGLRQLAQALPVGRAVVTDECLRHGRHVRWLRDAGVPVFVDRPGRDAGG